MSLTFQFGDGYVLRLATAADLDRARAWTNADPAHRGKIAPEFWTEQSGGVESYVLTDRSGEIFFFRVERVARVLIQFPPDEDDMNYLKRDRVKAALTAGLGFLDMALGARGYSEIVFDSASRLLRLFAIARLKFSQRPETLSRRLQVFNPRPKDAPEDVSGGNEASGGQESLHGAIHDALEGGK